jgi:hypothetical protein
VPRAHVNKTTNYSLWVLDYSSMQPSMTLLLQTERWMTFDILDNIRNTQRDDFLQRYKWTHNKHQYTQFCKIINKVQHMNRTKDLNKLPITYLGNLSITTVILLTRITETNQRSEIRKHRPVSILCMISQILEKAVNKQLEAHQTQHNFLYQLQSCFMSSYSTDTCLIYLFDHIK